MGIYFIQVNVLDDIYKSQVEKHKAATKENCSCIETRWWKLHELRDALKNAA